LDKGVTVVTNQITRDTLQIIELLQHTTCVLQEQLKEFNTSGQVCISDIEQLVYDLRGELFGVFPESSVFQGKNGNRQS
jgi:hypothetical protein